MPVEKARSLLGGDHYSGWTEQDLGRAREDLERRMQARADAVTQLAPADQPKLIALRDIFSLDPLEWLILMFALSVELDGRYARVFGFLNDDVSRKRPTASLIAHILPGDSLRAWRAQGLLQNGPLADYQLLSPDPEEATRLPGTEVGLVPAAELVAYVLAGDTHGPHYMAAISIIGPPMPAARRTDNDPEQALREKIRHCIDSPGQKPLIHLPGDTAQRCWFERLLGELGLTIVRLDGAALPDEDPGRFAQAAIAAARVARLHDAALLMTGFSRLSSSVDATLLNDAAVNSVWSLVPLVATDGPLSLTDMAARGRTVWQIERPAPTARTRAALWSDEADRHGFTLASADSAQIAQTLSFDTPQIAATLSLCGSPSEPGGALTLKSLKVAARQVARQSVPPLVRRIEAVFKKWDDIVLPEPVKNQLKQIPQHVSHAERVLQDWGFAARLPYGQGVAALFSGLSGTGKTMAAQIIAADLGVELFQVDLAKTASKYIGETEKNLDVIFEAAEQSSAVLLFDEADSLFGKRSEVKDAHDLYANFQVAYLLQRMEAYAGVAILTTNMKQNLDTGFIRRLRFFVEFPAPNAEEREAIWERSFPEATPGRNAIDFNALARRLAVTGGHIQQIAVRAAFAAAAEKSGVTMRHIVEATHYELTKLGMLNVERNLADLAA
jgi:AAA+ superfamily predicted ATPase